MARFGRSLRGIQLPIRAPQPGPEIHNGAVGFSGVGSVAVAAALTLGAAVSASGAGTASFAGQRIVEAAVGYAGVGTATLAAQKTTNGAVSYTGAGTATFAGSASSSGAVSYAGAATTAFAGQLIAQGAVAYAGTGTAAFNGSALLEGAATYTGAGAATYGGAITASAAASYSGAATVSFSGQRISGALAAFAGEGSVAFAGNVTAAAAVAYSGVGSATFTPAVTSAAAVAFSGTGTTSFAGTTDTPFPIIDTFTGSAAELSTHMPDVGGAWSLRNGPPLRYLPGMTIAGESFARGSEASYVDEDGIVQWASTGVKRDAHYINGVRHLLIEPAAINRVRRSLAYSDTIYWGRFPDVADVEQDVLVSPSGQLNASRIVTNAGHVVAAFIYQEIINVGDNIVCTGSRWMKASGLNWALIYIRGKDGASIGTGYVNLIDGSVGTVTPGPLGMVVRPGIAYPNGWFRFDYTFNSISGGQNLVDFIALAFDNEVVEGDTDGESGIAVWGDQIEERPFVTTYVHNETATQSANAREPDMYELPHPLTTPQAMSLYVDTTELGVRASGLPTDGRVVHVGDRDATAGLHLLFDAATAEYVSAYDNGTDDSFNSAAVSPVRGDRVRFRVTLDASGNSGIGAILGVTETFDDTSTDYALPADWGADPIVAFGGSPSNQQIPVALRSVVIADGVRSFAELETPFYSGGLLALTGDGYLDRGDSAPYNALYLNAATPATPNYEVVAEMRARQSANGQVSMGVGARVHETDVTGYFTWFDPDGLVYLYKVVTGVATELGSVPLVIATGEQYNIRLTVHGSTITSATSLNGAPYIDQIAVTDTDITDAGKAAIFSVGGMSFAAPSDVQIDAFRANAITWDAAVSVGGTGTVGFTGEVVRSAAVAYAGAGTATFAADVVLALVFHDAAVSFGGGAGAVPTGGAGAGGIVVLERFVGGGEREPIEREPIARTRVLEEEIERLRVEIERLRVTVVAPPPAPPEAEPPAATAVPVPPTPTPLTPEAAAVEELLREIAVAPVPSIPAVSPAVASLVTQIVAAAPTGYTTDDIVALTIAISEALSDA